MAIAYDNSASFTVVGSGTTSTSFTTSGSNRFLIVNAGEKITALTYGGVSMTKYVDFEPSIQDGNENHVNVWTLANPASGSNTLAATISSSDDEIIGIVSYNGVQSSNPEANATAYSNNGIINTQVNNLSASVTTLTDNAWTVMLTRGVNSTQTFTAGTGTLRVSGASVLDRSHSIIDTNGVVSPAGSSTLQADWASGTGFMSNVILSLKPVTVPVAPTIGTATVISSSQVSVSFTPNGDGGSAITGYTVTSTPGSITGTGASSPIVVSGLTAGTSYTFTVHATNAIGDSAESSATSAVTPQSSFLLMF